MIDRPLFIMGSSAMITIGLIAYHTSFYCVPLLVIPALCF